MLITLQNTFYHNPSKIAIESEHILPQQGKRCRIQASSPQKIPDRPPLGRQSGRMYVSSGALLIGIALY